MFKQGTEGDFFLTSGFPSWSLGTRAKDARAGCLFCGFSLRAFAVKLRLISMTMDTSHSDVRAPAGDGGGRGERGAAIALFSMAGALAVVLLVLPGFVTAGFSRMDGVCWSYNGVLDWDLWLQPSPLTRERHVEYMILTPSAWMMKRSDVIRKFYTWQYRAAGGFVLFDLPSRR